MADDTEARFQALIEAEYGPRGGDPAADDAVDALDALAADPDAGRGDAADAGDDQAQAPRLVVPFSALPSPRSWTPAEEDDEDYVPPPPAPVGPVSTPAIVAGLLVTAAAVVGVLMIARVALPWWAPGAGLVCFAAGLVVAFSRLPRDRPDDPDEGAVV